MLFVKKRQQAVLRLVELPAAGYFLRGSAGEKEGPPYSSKYTLCFLHNASKFLFPQPQVTCVPLSQFQSAQLITPTPNIGSVIGVKEIPKVNTSKGNSKWKKDYGCTVPVNGATFIKNITRVRRR
ncbi:hypothetical protein TSUD_395020 [Trifolium subterraneum]|uniref:Uncharacterized protein n=1 Tax=Trifolium subterraneum TaxID=3900 RepID=A0A2Z6MVT4_TRISU|nr:hypothetical protein TSUD_395020 [Trifolium subterraneum]